ncbi:gamma-glutamyltransferase [Leucobacter rhizosphaerae]|uniref:Gamma-glutamyltransferase n=1 Tax=Leucobacter rhizosphaerae TaxID=2932245 RepID=A0ABY4FZX0_9MICO|nr:gamma-glutamyltransferase [Leucobacter rhizosphaerae]UOQ61810.1 gamma-glutamyltransferase [Leucobacter rhizosphaerae]
MSAQPNSRGAIATSHHLATEAGAAVLEAGGNAVDAALAAAATLCVVYPNNVALGGDLVALVRSPDGEVRFLNATGTAPSGQSLDVLRERHGDTLPLRGIDTVTVPGGVRGWQALHEFAATRSWAEHLAPAIRLAEEGFPNSRSVAAALVEAEPSLAQDPGARDVFYPGGTPLAEGAELRQPALARSLRLLAERGADEFYAGELADRWIAGLAALGSRITRDDTVAYRPVWGAPLVGEFAGLRILTGPPNTSGFMLLRALNAVAAGIDDPLGAGAGALAAAFRASNAVRAAELADPAFGGLSGEELVALPDPIDPRAGAPKASGDTVGFSAISADGWAVSFVNSVYWDFGSHILEPESGIIFQNRGTSFSLDPASPNAFAPGKRPRHTLMPVLILDGHDVAWVPATMGGAAQPQIHTQLLLRSLAGATPHDATHAPRWIVNEDTGSGPVTVTAEADVPQIARDAIEAAGFSVEIVPRYTEDLGHSNLIRVVLDGYTAASDPRSDGSALVVGSG